VALTGWEPEGPDDHWIDPAPWPATRQTVHDQENLPDITSHGNHHLTWKGERDVSYPDPKYSGNDGEVSAILRPADQPYDLEMSKGGTQLHYLASGASTKGEFALYRWDFSGRRSGPDPHFHKTVSESFYILSGTVKLYDGRRWADAKPGDFLFVPANAVHRFEDFSDDLELWVVFYGPEGGEKP